MVNRQTRNVSTATDLEKFVESMVASGRYKSASEVHRTALRLLEEQERARLLEKALVEGLTAEEAGRLPPELLATARAHIKHLVAEGTRDRDAGRVSDGPTAMNRIREGLMGRTPA
jgi:antitoxin ParD1/3/4